MTATNIDLPGQTRVWIYQADQPFPAEAVEDIQRQISDFTTAWVSHNRQLRAHGELVHRRFVVLMVDESQAGASGCSIDKSVAFIKWLGAQYGVDLFDRMRFSYRGPAGEVRTVSRDEFSDLYTQGLITDDTTVFDTLVNSKGVFDESFEKPLGASWHKRMV